jgi:glutathione peroxidase-family protein
MPLDTTYWDTDVIVRQTTNSHKAQPLHERKTTRESPVKHSKPLFRKLKILTLTSQYILSLMRFLTSNMGKFTFNSSIHNFNTRQRLKLHKPTAHLKLYQSSPYYTCIRIYNNLPGDLASQVTHKKQFVWNLKKYLIERPYYTLQEFMNAQWGGEVDIRYSIMILMILL